MAQVFPLNVDDLGESGAPASLSGMLAALPDPWTLLRDRRIGDEQAEPVEVVLVHPEIGVALVDEAPRDPGAGARRLCQYLDQQRFGEFFPGELPIVTLSVARDDFDTIGEQLASAFEAAPRLSIADADWADAVIELLMVPDDLAMAPVGDTAPSPALEPETAPAREAGFEGVAREPFPKLGGERSDEARREQRGERQGGLREPLELRAPLLEGEECPLPLMVDWPFAASYQRKRRRGRVAALAVILMLLAAGGFAAWDYAGEGMMMAVNDFASRPSDSAGPTPSAAPPTHRAGPRSQVELALPPQSSGDRAAPEPPAPKPPPVPAASPIVMAQKPYAPPPPAPPKPTPIKPLPQVVVMAEKSYAPLPPAPPKPTPVEPLPQVAAAHSAPPAPAPSAPPQETARATPPTSRSASSADTHKLTQTANREAQPRSAAPARQQSQASRARPSEAMLNPPIDASDLPPLDESAPAEPHGQRSTQAAVPDGAGLPATAALGPPVPLWRAQARNAPPAAETAAAAPQSANRECRPYTSSTTLTGRGLRVEGIACRGSDGQWRLVSEVPMR